MTPPSWRPAPIAAPLPEAPSPIRLGLGANWRQFTLLVVVNAFVGAMVGLERTVVPLIAQADFGLVSKTVVLSFLVSFGIVKALANLFAGQLADRIGRKPLLVAGWLAGLPVALLIIWAPSWGWIVFANVLLGVNQGLCWSTTVIMKIDLVGPARRGLAMGLNECAGDRKSTRLNSSHGYISYAVFCLKKKKTNTSNTHLDTSTVTTGIAIFPFTERTIIIQITGTTTFGLTAANCTVRRLYVAPTHRQC